MKGDGFVSKKLFDFVIGNPPYQESRDNTKDMPVYNNFMDEAYTVGDKVELITPARFLFNAGATPKQWNQKMLNDEHFKVFKYEADSSKVFSNNDIKGGVAIHYKDDSKDFGKIETFITFDELRSIFKKADYTHSMVEIGFSEANYHFSNIMYKEHPEILENKLVSKGNESMIATNVLDSLNNIVFFSSKPSDDKKYIKIWGRKNNKRDFSYIDSRYVSNNTNLLGYKVFLPKSNGSGALGETLSTPLVGEPLVGEPLVGATQTFISFGNFQNENEANSCLKYIKSKLARTMLGITKITQHNPVPIWKYVPLQDFTSNSDIDWSQSVANIDKQLYKKYNLSDEEIDFIETHVKEME